MRSRLLITTLVVLAVVSAVLATILVQREVGQRTAGVGTALIGGPFTLTAGDGRIVTERDLLGRWTLVYFGYTFCPDICPLGLQTIGQALDTLPPAMAARVLPLFITVDPERDTQEVVRSYVASFHPTLVGLTGTAAQIDQVERAYRVYARKADGGDPKSYLMDHSTFTYVMGPNGRYVTHFGHDATAEDMARKLQELIAAGG